MSYLPSLCLSKDCISYWPHLKYKCFKECRPKYLLRKKLGLKQASFTFLTPLHLSEWGGHVIAVAFYPAAECKHDGDEGGTDKDEG